MSAIGAALTGFGEGFADGFAARKRREERAEDRKIRREELDAYKLSLEKGGSQPGAGRTRSPLAGGFGSPPKGGGTYSGEGDLKSLIDHREGGGDYNTLFGFSNNGRFKGTNVADMTVGQAIEFSRPDGEYGQWSKAQLGYVATPMGRYQIVGTTLRNTAKAMGLDMNTPFNQKTQDAMFDHLAQQRLGGSSSMSGKLSGMRSEWDGFKHVSDRELSAAIQKYEQGSRSDPQPRSAKRASVMSQKTSPSSKRWALLKKQAGGPI